MRNLYAWVVKNPKKILIFFLILAVFGAIFQNFVEVNYDRTVLTGGGHHSSRRGTAAHLTGKRKVEYEIFEAKQRYDFVVSV